MDVILTSRKSLQLQRKKEKKIIAVTVNNVCCLLSRKAFMIIKLRMIFQKRQTQNTQTNENNENSKKTI